MIASDRYVDMRQVFPACLLIQGIDLCFNATETSGMFSGTKKYEQIIAANCGAESIPFLGAHQSTDRNPKCGCASASSLPPPADSGIASPADSFKKTIKTVEHSSKVGGQSQFSPFQTCIHLTWLREGERDVF